MKKERVAHLLKLADVEINGHNPWDVQIYDERAYRSLESGALSIGEAFMDKWWDTKDLNELVFRLRQAKVYRQLVSFDAWALLIKSHIFNLQKTERTHEVGQAHYDLHNDVFKLILGKWMLYSCPVWEEGDNLDTAQEKALESICQQLKLKPGDKLLDIGCGWGGFMKYATERYGVSCVGLTISEKQAEFGRKLCQNLPVQFIVSDYREYQASTQFDHVVSVEMLEAVGPKNLKVYNEVVFRHLKKDGNFFVQTSCVSERSPIASTWLNKYIFPNGVLPSLPRLHKEAKKCFEIKWEKEIGSHYEKTLTEWWKKFEEEFTHLSSTNSGYDERFYRMWKFYLQTSAAFFRTKDGKVWQALLKPKQR